MSKYNNLDEFKSLGIHWVVLHKNSENVRQFDSFQVKYIPKEIEINSLEVKPSTKIYISIKIRQEQKYFNEYLKNTSK